MQIKIPNHAYSPSMVDIEDEKSEEDDQIYSHS